MTDEVIGVVGAGIIGLAIGREIVLRRPGTRVVVMEKEDRVAVHQTGHNSGVVHAGIYYAPGSLKAQLCSRGAAMLREYCAERAIPYEERGKLVVAVSDEDVVRLDALHARASENAVPGLRRIGPHELTDIEPHATGLAALHSPHTAITDFVRIAQAYAEDIDQAGGEVRFSFPVDTIVSSAGGVAVTSRGPAFPGDPRPGRPTAAGHASERATTVDRLIICAGLQSDSVAGLAGDTAEPRIIPFRGEYLRVLPAKAALVRGLIYPVPDPRYPFLGVHFTPMVSGDVEVGPNAVLALAREGYSWRDVNLSELRRIASWPGMWRMAGKHWRTGLREVYGSLSMRGYMRSAQRYVPAIGPRDVERARSGVRAQALDRDGSLVDDFRIHRLGPITAVRNAPSPGATSSLAIAEHVVDSVFADA